MSIPCYQKDYFIIHFSRIILPTLIFIKYITAEINLKTILHKLIPQIL